MSDVPQIYADHLAAVTGGGPDAIRAAWEPDGVLEFPFGANVGAPTRLDGVEEIVEMFGRPAERWSGFSFTNMRAWRIADANEWVLEMHGSATTVETGEPYEQDYIIRFGIADSGRLAWMREFWDPTRV